MDGSELKNIEDEIKNTQILILAGGKAKRMNNPDMPKAMLELNGKPLIDYCIEQYRRCGFTDFKLLLGHLHEKIENHVKDGSRYNANIKYSIEPEAGMGRGKALNFALDNGTIDKKKRSIVCFPDDLILDKKFPVRLLLQHIYGVEKYGCLVTVVFVVGTEYPFGVAELDKDGLVSQFDEKPFIPKTTSTGVYIMEPPVYEMINEKIGKTNFPDHLMEKEIFPQLAALRKVYSIVLPSGCWISINTQKEYEQAEKRLSSGNGFNN